MQINFTKLTQQRLSERVRDILEKAILENEFRQTGCLPKETELSKSFGVSRTVIREAIQNLKAEGLIVSKVGSGNFVSEYPADRIQRVFERFGKLHANQEGLANYSDLRMVVEVEAVSRVAARCPADTLARLREFVAEMSRDDCTDERYRELDLSFHLAIAQASGNPFFSMILQPIQEHGLRLVSPKEETKESMSKAHQMNTREHAGIVDAIVRNDVPLAASIMRAHLGRRIEPLRRKAQVP